MLFILIKSFKKMIFNLIMLIEIEYFIYIIKKN